MVIQQHFGDKLGPAGTLETMCIRVGDGADRHGEGQTPRRPVALRVVYAAGPQHRLHVDHRYPLPAADAEERVDRLDDLPAPRRRAGTVRALVQVPAVHVNRHRGGYAWVEPLGKVRRDGLALPEEKRLPHLYPHSFFSEVRASPRARERTVASERRV